MFVNQAHQSRSLSNHHCDTVPPTVTPDTRVPILILKRALFQTECLNNSPSTNTTTTDMTIESKGSDVARRQSKKQLQESKRRSESLLFLRDIDRVVVTGTHTQLGVERVEFIDLTILLKSEILRSSTTSLTVSKANLSSVSSTSEFYHDATNTSDYGSIASSHPPSGKHAKKERKKLRPSVDFNTSKAVTTLELVQGAISEWNRKSHEADTAGPCAYCSQFNSPAALALWPKKKSAREVTGLSVAVNNDRLQQYEQWINSCLESARTVPSDDDVASSCESVAHIPSILASLLQHNVDETKWRDAPVCALM